MQKVVFPGGFYIDPVNRQYLTDKVNSLFRLNVELSRVSEGVKKNSPLKKAGNPIQYTTMVNYLTDNSSLILRKWLILSLHKLPPLHRLFTCYLNNIDPAW